MLLDKGEARLAVQQIASDEPQRKCSSSNLSSFIAGASCILAVTELHDLSHWLSPPDPSTNYNIACRARRLHEGTAEWFLEGSTFKRWKSTKSTNSLLWVHGKRVSVFLPSHQVLMVFHIAGSGKSVLWFVFLTYSYLRKLISA